MALVLRKTPNRDQVLARIVASLNLRINFSHDSLPAIGNGGTAGRLRTNATVVGKVAGVPFSKASTDDLWNLSAETDTTASQYRAYWLYVNAAGTASIGAGANAASAAAALAALPAPDETKCIFGVAVAAPSTDFDAGGGLTGQTGFTVYNAIPAGASLDGTKGFTFATPERISLVAG